MKNEDAIITDELIVQYLTGEASPDQAMALHDWLILPENKSYFENFQSAWQNSYPSKKISVADRQRAWKTLQHKLNRSTFAVEEKKSRNSYGLFLKIAASITIVLSIGIFAYLKLRPETLPQVRITTRNSLHKLILPDSSRAIMGYHTKLEYPKNFNGSLREIYLSGEAFFEVTHNINKPFIVHTRIADVRVVGTAFNVAIKNNKVEISVAKGKVLVYTPYDSIYVEPGQTAMVDSNSRSINPVGAADLNTWGYATRKFEFKDTQLNEVFTCIEKSYPYFIEVKNNAIKNCKLTAVFEDKSAEYIITLIAETLDLTLTKKGHVFILEGKGCP